MNKSKYMKMTNHIFYIYHLYLLMKIIEINIKIEKVMADASTIHGEKICKKLLKMEYVRDTSHNSKIYIIEGNEFINIINRFMGKL